MIEIEKYLTMRELATYLNVARATIYRYMKIGLPSVKLGGVRRFKASEVDQWLKNQPK